MNDVVEPVRLGKKTYERELERLQAEMVTMQEWIKSTGTRVVVVMEGRDTAGKGGVIKRLTYRLNPRTARVVALAAPSDRERTQWYFQRYLNHLPAAGEIVFFDRSWYNRAGVERVMGFCTDEEYDYFVRTCPLVEQMLIDDGFILVKYWLSVSDAQQRKRFKARIDDPTRRWKLSPMDLEAQSRWVDYAEAKDQMFAHTDTPESPWWVVDADDKKAARLNLMADLLSRVPYQPVEATEVSLPPRQEREYVRPPLDTQTFVPTRYLVG